MLYEVITHLRSPAAAAAPGGRIRQGRRGGLADHHGHAPAPGRRALDLRLPARIRLHQAHHRGGPRRARRDPGRTGRGRLLFHGPDPALRAGLRRARNNFV